MTADALISTIADIDGYDILALAPAKGQSNPDAYGDLLESPQALALVSAAAEKGLVIYAPCAGVRVLAAAGVIDGKRVLGEPKFEDEYVAAGATYVGGTPKPMIDGNIVTVRRSLFYHAQNSEAVERALAAVRQGAGGEKQAPVSQVETVAQDGALWTRTLGGPHAEGGRSIATTSDGGFVVAGYTYSHGAGDADVYLLKVDAEGQLVWARTFGGAGWEYGSAASQTRDGGYIVVGDTTSQSVGDKDVYLVKTDAEGHEVWSKTFGGAGLDVGQAVCESDDGGYVVAGYTEPADGGESDAYLVKVDAQGNEVWAKTFGGRGPEVGRAICRANDGGYVVAGATGSGSANSDVYLLKVDADGDELWTQSFNNGEYDWGNAVCETRDGGYTVVGNTDEGAIREAMDAYLIKTDAQGNKVWAKAFGPGQFYDYGTSVCETDDGGYVVVGAAKSPETNKNDVYLVRVSPTGDVVWEKTFGGPGSDWGSAVCKAPDGGYVVVGHTSSYGAGSFDVWLIKVAEGLP
ncbi:MAG: DJ-1/PfpI family protein [Chloroflexi bacterium]|nr:DJ-1/PfpI family protein [Chloroflexota bacterium]MBU1749498.1 DJ-1/PfpI family protein [Chloroflexota bacterium]MBU1880112.1 DJ-1/PfpI family protein [Chloroflexota bacterium]